MLYDILKNKKCFKLVCGAGNEDVEEVEKLVYLYSKAGCNFFDLSANVDVVKAAKRGLKLAGIEKDRYLCVSVGMKGDLHVSKANIDAQLCTNCAECIKVCPQNAIVENDKNNYVNQKKCIGCGRCIKACKLGAISQEYIESDLENILPKIINEGIDCIELHTYVDDESKILEKWKILNDLYSGFLSICVGRLKLGNEQLINTLNTLLDIRKPYTTIIQADGSPMSGEVDDYKSTLQAVAAAEIIQNMNFPAFVLLSGGTNSKTSELASQCGIDISGVAVGSYARKIVREYILRDDFYTHKEVFYTALNTAKTLINKTFEYL